MGDWDAYLYIVLGVINLITEDNHWETEAEELDMFLGQNFVVTYHDLLFSFIDEIFWGCKRDNRHLQSGSDPGFYHYSNPDVSLDAPANMDLA